MNKRRLYNVVVTFRKIFFSADSERQRLAGAKFNQNSGVK